MNKPAFLGLSILDLSKTVMYQFWYDYVKPKYGEKAKLCYTDTDNFLVDVKRDDINEDIAEDFKAKLDSLNYESDRPLPKGKKQKSNWINQR